MALIVIDPGHGGRNTGVKHNGIAEKDATLELALTLKYVLTDELNLPFEVHLTRDKDETIPWSSRLVPATVSIAVHYDIPRGGIPIYYQQGRCDSYFVAEFLRINTGRRHPVWSTREAVHTGRRLYIDDARHPFVLWEADRIDNVIMGEEGREYRLALARPMALALAEITYILERGL